MHLLIVILILGAWTVSGQDFKRSDMPTIHVKPSDNFTEGTIMEVTCSVQNSTTRPEKMTLTLYQENHILKNSTSGSLTHSKMATINDTGNYTCTLDWSEASISTSVMVTVEELFPMPHLVLLTLDYIERGVKMILQCSVSTLSNRDAALQDFYFILDNKRYMRKGGKFSMRSRMYKSVEFTCEVTIANITKTSNPLMVKIDAPTAPVKNVYVSLSPYYEEIEEGRDLNLICKVDSGPLLTRFWFYFQRDGSMTLMYNVTKTDSEAKYSVKSFTKENDGAYFCAAANKDNKECKISQYRKVKAIMAGWKTGIIGAFIILFILAAIPLINFVYSTMKTKGKDGATNSSSTTPIISKKSGGEMKSGDYYSVAGEKTVQEGV